MQRGLPDESAGDIDRVPGSVLAASEDGVDIAAGKGSVLRVRQLQRPGGRMLPAGDFLRGFELPVGTVLGGSEMRELTTRT